MTKKAKVFRPTAFAFPYLAVTLVFVIIPLILVLVYAVRGEGGGLPPTMSSNSLILSYPLSLLICFLRVRSSFERSSLFRHVVF